MGPLESNEETAVNAKAQRCKDAKGRNMERDGLHLPGGRAALPNSQFLFVFSANAQGRQNHRGTESCREKDQGQSSMILSGHDSVIPGCVFAPLRLCVDGGRTGRKSVFRGHSSRSECSNLGHLSRGGLGKPISRIPRSIPPGFGCGFAALFGFASFNTNPWHKVLRPDFNQLNIINIDDSTH